MEDAHKTLYSTQDSHINFPNKSTCLVLADTNQRTISWRNRASVTSLCDIRALL